MFRPLFAQAALVLGLLAAASEAPSQDKKKPDDKKAAVKMPAGTFITPQEAGPDFAIQGEYVGEIPGKGRYAAQVVARGEGAFDIHFLAGGLPGAGWAGKSRAKVAAKLADGKAAFADAVWSGTVAGGVLTGTSGGAEFTLKRVERQSPTAGAAPPPGAVVLFDGKSAEGWKGGQIVEGGLLYCGATSVKAIGAGKLHIEFRTPFRPKASGQGRGNSGVYLFGKEIQVLDSFGLGGEKNEGGAFYGSARPAVNMCLPPLTWQTYDVEIRQTDKGELAATVLHNGVRIHEDFPLKVPAARTAPVNLQHHGNYVVYRNIWFVPAADGKSK